MSNVNQTSFCEIEEEVPYEVKCSSRFSDSFLFSRFGDTVQVFFTLIPGVISLDAVYIAIGFPVSFCDAEDTLEEISKVATGWFHDHYFDDREFEKVTFTYM